jgi:hypothetical protein
MKMKPEHLTHITTEINTFVKGAGGWTDVVQKYQTGKFPNSDKVKDLHTRLCWDLMHYSGLIPYTCRELYTYLQDAHILTALKKFVPKPVKKY